MDDLVSRLAGEQARLAAEQGRLEDELAKTRDRVSRMRVDQSITNYNLAELQRQQQPSAPAVEVKLQTTKSEFVLRDIDPSAMQAWRAFVAQVIEAQGEGNSMSVSDPAGDAGGLSPCRGGTAMRLSPESMQRMLDEFRAGLTAIRENEIERMRFTVSQLSFGLVG